MTELEDQLEPLSIQSAKAIRFKELKEELKANEIAMYVHQIEQIYENWTETNQRLDKLKRERAGAVRFCKPSRCAAGEGPLGDAAAGGRDREAAGASARPERGVREMRRPG
ncbi:hypothetical protein LJK88_21980 [Paenibacillus sp. P26]|nr:hypothetical protein LJK88_21980 [Paenibacillus sp. P26]